MKTGPQIALAVLVGYALGRSRKMKLAITIGGMLAGRRLTTDPKELLAKGTKLIGASPELSKLTGDVRERLTDAAKTAAVAAATSKIDSLGESLSKRAAGLRSPRGEDEFAEDEDREPAEARQGTGSEEEKTSETRSKSGSGTKSTTATTKRAGSRTSGQGRGQAGAKSEGRSSSQSGSKSGSKSGAKSGSGATRQGGSGASSKVASARKTSAASRGGGDG
jgi:hypothetical protein